MINEDNKCEYYKVKEDTSQLFLAEEKQWCTLEDEECAFEGDDKVCPYRLGIFY